MKLIRACRSHDPSCDMLEVLRGWSFDKERSEECSAIEKQVQRSENINNYCTMSFTHMCVKMFEPTCT